MDTNTPFDLNQCIDNWKSTLAKNPAMSQDNIEELVCHMEDEIEQLTKGGLTTEESFIIAQKGWVM